MGIREDNQTLGTGGRARYLKREGKLVTFKIKQEITRQDIKQNVNRDRVNRTLNAHSNVSKAT